MTRDLVLGWMVTALCAALVPASVSWWRSPDPPSAWLEHYGAWIALGLILVLIGYGIRFGLQLAGVLP